MNKDNKNANCMKRVYNKPCLEQVQLVPEEAVLATCKTNQAGPIQECKMAYCARTPKVS